MALFAMTWPLAAATKHKVPKRRTHMAVSPSRKAPKSKSPHKLKGRSSRRHSRSYQQAPTPERYKEIQQALADKGYYKGSVNGEWGPDSVEALKRFQTEQSLTPDGKLTSLSLIAMGLGPKKLTAQSSAPAASPHAQPPGAPSQPPPTEQK